MIWEDMSYNKLKEKTLSNKLETEPEYNIIQKNNLAKEFENANKTNSSLFD